MVLQEFNSKNSVMDCEAVIVGGGPAGISTWLHLKKYAPQLANHTLVIEKAVFPRDKLCAGGVGGWSADVLEHLEVELDISSLFVSDVEFKFGKETYLLHQPNFFRVVQRVDFDHALAKTAVNRGLELHEDEMLIDIKREKNKLIAITNKEEYRVKILVGADGALSLARRTILPPHKPQITSTIQIFAPVDPQYDTEFDKRKIVLNFAPINEGLQGYLWHVPCLKNGAPSIAHGIGDFRIYPDKPRADMKNIFSRELRTRNIFQEPNSWSSHPIRWLSNESTVSQPNILLAGDAAGIEPAFGGGIHIALSYGEVAAKAVIDAFQNNDFSFHNYKQRLQSHLVGRYISECTRLALKLYGGKENPLKPVRKFFNNRYGGANLLFLLLAGNRVRHN